MGKLRMYFYFFRSTWLLSILTGMGILAVSTTVSPMPLESIFFFIPTTGLGIDLLYKELTNKEEYLFFNNQGIHKFQLWAVTFLLSAVTCFILFQIFRLCVHAWK